MDQALRDLRLAARTLLRNRAFAATAIVTLGLALGANVVIFSLVNAILLRPLPGVAEPERLVNVHRTAADGSTFHGFSHPDYRDLRERAGAVSLAAFNGRGLSLGGGSTPEVVGGQLVSGNYFAVLGVRPSLGRLLTESDDAAAGASPVAVISHSLWQRRLRGDASIVGQTVRLNGFPFTVVGVAPEGFQGHFVGFPFEVWVPLAMAAQAAPDENLGDRKAVWLELVGRLRPGLTLGQAQAALRSVMEGLAQEHPRTLEGAGVDMRPMTGVDDSLRGGVIGFLALLQAVAALVLLIACVNLAGIFLARATARGREMALRVALGAGRTALLRQALVETLLLFYLGGVAGLGLAFWTADLLHAFQPSFPVPLRFDLRLDARVVGLTALLTLGTGVAFGLGPALQASRVNLLATLRDAAGAPAPRIRLRGLLVAGQVALSTVLLAGAGLFLRTLQQARTIDPGFDPAGVHTARLDLTLLARDEAQGRAFYEQLLDRLAGAPGVQSAGLALSLPLRSFAPPTTSVRLEDQTSPSEPGLPVAFNVVTPGFFETLGIPVIGGRDFLPSDTARTRPVAVVNQALARRLWPGRDAVGQRLRQDGTEREVVGLVRDSKNRRLTEDPQPQVYVLFVQHYSPRMRLLVRAAGGEAAAAGLVRREVAALDKDLPLLEVMPMREAIGFALFPQRLAGAVASALGALGLVLAATGLYGVVAYSASRRTREMGVRLALGARRTDLLAMVLGQGLRLALAGVVLGAVLAAGAARSLRGLLHGVSPADPLTFATIAALMTLVALLASYIPARRAARVDPMVALRYE